MQTTIVTGATQGIGKAIALALLNDGQRVIALGRSRQKLDTLLKDAGPQAGRLATEALDISDGAGFESSLRRWIADFGGIDHLVNAAGVLESGRLLDASTDAIRRVVETNFLSTLDLTLPVARHMADRKRGSIVTIGSNSAPRPGSALGSIPRPRRRSCTR